MKLKRGAFENCSSLISVELPNSIEKLGDEYGPVAYGSGGVFQNCTLLQEVNIPKNLQFLGAYTFFWMFDH
ncbi:MAG: leucine-rich repeat protein [Clostridium sp.]